MERRYRQRGYQDEPRPSREDREPFREDKRERGPRLGYGPREPRTVNMPGFSDVMKCARCGERIIAPVAADSQCGRCGSDLHSCAQCTWFDTGSRFECTQPIPQRVAPKDARNTCSVFEARVTVERQTGSTTPPSGAARQAFDDLFK